MHLESATIAVSLDEGCFALHEENIIRRTLKRNSSETEWRRVQQLYVVRNDRIAVYEEDIGPAVPHDEGFNLIGGVLFESGRIEIYHTVAEMREWADEERDTRRVTSLLKEMAPIDLRQGLIDHYEQIEPRRVNRSVYGHKWHKQRN